MVKSAFSILAAMALVATQASGQTTTTTGMTLETETFPDPGIIPTAKPEWLAVLKAANITNAPIQKSLNGAGPQAPADGKDLYCDWTFTGCYGPEDLYVCPKGQWSLTYDDGPSEFSPKLYDALKQANVKATFFMVGGQVVKLPQYAKRAHDEGHEIAMHTWSHSFMTTLTNEQIVAELKWNELAIKLATGVTPRFFRPPYGDIDNRVRDVAKAFGFIPVIWSHDTFDWEMTTNPAFNEAWVTGNVTQWASEAGNSATGGVSLEHDLYEKTVNAALKVIPIIQGAYQTKMVGECTNTQPYAEVGKDPASSSNNNPTTSKSPVSPNALSKNSPSQPATNHGQSSVSSPMPLMTLLSIVMASLYALAS